MNPGLIAERQKANAYQSMEGGAAWYAFQLRSFTTTSLSPQEIHDIGLSEVARIRAEMLTVIAKTDWSAADPSRASLSDDARFALFIEYLRTDPRFYCKTPEELLARYRSFCKEVDPHLPELLIAERQKANAYQLLTRPPEDSGTASLTGKQISAQSGAGEDLGSAWALAPSPLPAENVVSHARLRINFIAD